MSSQMSLHELVHVVDDDSAVRKSLGILLRTSRFDVRTYESPVAFLDALPGLARGCILTDVRMPELDGVELLRRVRTAGYDWPVIVMTAHGDIKLAVEAMRAGADDFIEKPFDDTDLLASLRTALKRRSTPGEAQDQGEMQQRLASLTPREAEVLQGLVAGNPNKTIAYDLNISPRTVEVYRANVMTKMNARSLAELVRMAISAQIPIARR